MLNWTFARRPGPGGPAATGITVARPGHDCDCVQAPVRLVACRAAGVVTCSRLVVRKMGLGPSAGSAVGNSCWVNSCCWQLMLSSSSAGWVRKLTASETRAMAGLITAMTRNVTRCTGIHPTWMRNWPLHPNKTKFIELWDAACTLLTYKLLYNLLSCSCTAAAGF